MFTKFLTVLIYRVTSYLQDKPDFFKLSAAEKEKFMKEWSIPATFKVYLAAVTEKEFIEDLALILKYVQGAKDLNVHQNSFFTAFLSFITQELARKIDYLDGEYYLMPKESRKKFVDKLINSDSSLAEALKDILTNYTYQQIGSETNNLGVKVKGAPYLVVQSPRAITAELKKEIREHLLEKYPYSLPVFQINKKLIGGIRIFQDGKNVDRSWLSRVLRFTSLTSV